MDGKRFQLRGAAPCFIIRDTHILSKRLDATNIGTYATRKETLEDFAQIRKDMGFLNGYGKQTTIVVSEEEEEEEEEVEKKDTPTRKIDLR
jgi:hypothetical protein